MPDAPKRHVEVRLLVIALIDVTSVELAEALKAATRQPSSVAAVVATEAVSKLESVSYVEAAFVSLL